MSKYVRTKDGEVFDIHEYWSSKAFEIEPNEDYWVDEMLRRKGIDKKDCKVVSTIEELVDEYVVFNLNDEPRVFSSRFEAKNYHSNLGKTLYGAIWTGRGLIYVAKQNEKGELKLL